MTRPSPRLAAPWPWSPQDDLKPEVSVKGFDWGGLGQFAFGPGTNASSDFGSAMLVGVEFPIPGCWLIVARHREAVLRYTVLITDD